MFVKAILQRENPLPIILESPLKNFLRSYVESVK